MIPIRVPPVFRLLAVMLAVQGSGLRALAADPPAGFRDHIARLQPTVPDGFTLVVQPPFVVLGDEPVAVVEQRATNTVKWAVDRLKQEYFPRDPEVIIDIWLFRDQVSYTNHAFRLFHDIPASPFGYYSAEHQALVMNIATGSGTLAHEIVHAYLRVNFPNCPPWFDEGLASLYEAPVDVNGHIRGRINWRLKGLEQTIREGKTISFRRLTSMSAGEFYGDEGSTNYYAYYAQARYLCYYLQEKGLLKTYYREFSANVKQDPTGYETLQRVLRTSDMEKFKQQWEDFVLQLRKP
ncbi:MAG TPA: hypothetical protein VMB80_08950 [Candidatus Acidoferrum sp.]|nr:hypothetical protein [Candidatus Acidoferrum sp.]